MTFLQLACLGIVALYVGLRAAADEAPGAFVRRMALLAGAAWLAEDSVIRAYGFYHYAPGWRLFVDQVPLLIVLIWPVVIHSAWDLARGLCRGRRGRVPLVGAALVLGDAALIEPIAVHAGLWTWTRPGVFAVPPVGILGWALFAGLCMAALDGARVDGRRVARVLVAPLLTHVGLWAAWWGVFRWVSVPLAPAPFVAGAWAVSLLLAAGAVRADTRHLLSPAAILLRLPGAAFFFVLLVVSAHGDASLVAYALAFAPPYLAAMPSPRLYRPRVVP